MVLKKQILILVERFVVKSQLPQQLQIVLTLYNENK